MKKTFLVFLAGALVFGSSACRDSVEQDADKLVEIACEGERTTDEIRKKELRDQYLALEREIKVRYKKRDADAIRLADLHFTKLRDCLGYLPAD